MLTICFKVFILNLNLKSIITASVDLLRDNVTDINILVGVIAGGHLIVVIIKGVVKVKTKTDNSTGDDRSYTITDLIMSCLFVGGAYGIVMALIALI